MSNIKLVHSGGNSVSLTTPDSNPAANRTFKLPGADGTSGQAMVTDGSGALSFASMPTPSVAGITMMDQWRITNDNNKTDDQTIDSNWERSDTFFAQIGTGMSESSGIFTFPQTGIYLILVQLQMNGGASYAGAQTQVSTNSGGSFSTFTYAYDNPDGYCHQTMHGILDVTDEGTFRLRIQARNNSSTQYSGDTGAFRTGITFIRIGDT